MKKDNVVITSKQVAKMFDKKHNHVLRDIRNLKKKIHSNSPATFEERTFKDLKTGQEYPIFLMDEYGFTLLAMGFTGEKAMQFKIAYIDKFNRLENAIKQINIYYQLNDSIFNKEKER